MSFLATTNGVCLPDGHRYVGLIAILQDEPEREAFIQAIEAADSRAMSVASFLGTSMVIEARYGPDGVGDLDLFIAKARTRHLARAGSPALLQCAARFTSARAVVVTTNKSRSRTTFRSARRREIAHSSMSRGGDGSRSKSVSSPTSGMANACSTNASGCNSPTLSSLARERSASRSASAASGALDSAESTVSCNGSAQAFSRWIVREVLHSVSGTNSPSA